MDLNIMFTDNFGLKELTHSDTAITYGYPEQYEPTQDIIDNLDALAKFILQPLRDAYPNDILFKNEYGEQINANCGYRCLRVNVKVGGATDSQHLCRGKDSAADITAGSKEENMILFNLIQELNLPFDQLIAEGGKDEHGKPKFKWIHVSYNPTRNRKQVLYL